MKWKRATEKFGRIATSENYILLSGNRKEILFDKKGNLLWAKIEETETYNKRSSFSENENYIGMYRRLKHDDISILNTKTGEIEANVRISKGNISQFSSYFVCLDNLITVSGRICPLDWEERRGYYTYFIKFDKDKEIIDNGWHKGLVIGSSTSSFIGVYESDATDRHSAGGENSTKFTLNILEKDEK
ncbi:hypothetical protein ES705_13145 [subsurface metagenome]